MRALFAILLVAAPAHAERDAAPVRFAITGSIDADVVGTSLAAELARPVELAGDSCAAPCLAIAVRDTDVTVVFTPKSGPPRQRTVQLGDDRTQWPLVITLLAGNLVRDEAADVADLVPEAPPALPPGPVAAPPPVAAEAHGYRTFSIGLVPVVSTDLTDLDRRHFLSFSLIAGVAAGSSGFALSGVADVESGSVDGVQVAGVTAIAERLDGIQVTGVAAVAGEVNGVQVAGTAAVADAVAGVQVAGIASVADGRAATQLAGVATITNGNAGLQIAGVAAVADGNAHVQVGGVAAVADGDTNVQVAGVAAIAHNANVQVAGVAVQADHRSNVQIAGVASVADKTNIQIAGVAAVADRITGLQIAPINVAGRVDGMQFGIINIGGAGDGDSFGLINIVPGGRYDLEATVDTNRVGTLMFRHGGRRWHNVYGIGGHPVNDAGTQNDDVWMYGAGFGPTFRLAGATIDAEAIAWEVNHGARHESDLSILAQARLTIAVPLGPIALVAGGVLNTYVSTDHGSPFILERTTDPTTMNPGVAVTVWPSAFIGVRL